MIVTLGAEKGTSVVVPSDNQIAALIEHDLEA